MPSLEKLDYGKWPNNHRLSNGRIELVVTADVGPRIIRLGFVNGQNLFYEDAQAMGKTGGDEWRLYGGHRLWHAPEDLVRTYVPDNFPVTVEAIPGGMRVTQPNESANGIQKQMDITMNDGAARIRLVHRLTNTGPWPITVAVWALSVMAAGGTAIIPLPPRGEHPKDLLPTSQIAIWPYTSMADPRWTWGQRFILLRQTAAPPQKIGVNVLDGWAAYALGGDLLVKRFTPVPGATYPDLNSNVEVFTNEVMLEVETLGPITEIAPGQSVEQAEDWTVFDGVPAPNNDADVERDVLALIEQTRSKAVERM
ncbi:MAG: hypothetical protein JNL34_03325 [Anaerolineae bacterium]|nr:hypothetical protein [Anaerolineae bacterium]